MKKVLLYFSQVGGANALLPLLEEWETAYDTIITGRKLVCENLRNRGIEVSTHLDPQGREHAADHYTGWFENLSPDLVITDTIDFMRAPDGIVCRDLWYLAQRFGIPSIAYVDCWWGYDKRFLLPGETSPPILPDRIAVVDNLAKEDIIKAGYPEQKVAVLGSPRFELLSKLAIANRHRAKAALKEAAKLKSDSLILLFVSQPVEKVFGSAEAYGFTEKTTLAVLLKTLAEFPEDVQKRLSLIVLLHPEEDQDNLSRAVLGGGPRDISVEFRKEGNPLPFLLAADLVVGMFSIVLAEATILHVPVVSVQPNLKREEILITNAIGATLSVYDQDQLSHVLLDSLVNKNYRAALLERQDNFEVVADACSRWNRLVQERLAQSSTSV